MGTAKVCSRCKIEKDLYNDFNNKTNSRDGKQPYCKKCSSEAWRENYPVQRGVARNKQQRSEAKEVIAKYLKGQKCADCGATENLSLHPKSVITNALSRKYSLDRLGSIVKTCRILCENCEESR